MNEKREGPLGPVESSTKQKLYKVDGWQEGQEQEAREILITGDISAGELLALLKKAFPNTPLGELVVASTYDQEIYIGPRVYKRKK